MMAASGLSLDLDRIVDAEFETIVPGKRAEPVSKVSNTQPSLTVDASDRLELLRTNRVQSTKAGQPEQLTPAFLLCTLIAALVVFWVSGGHVLLY